MVTHYSKCGNNIVYQDFEGNPSCNDCGNVNDESWLEIFKKIDLQYMKEGDHEKRSVSDMDSTANMKMIESINCSHCNVPLKIEESDNLKKHHCGACSQEVDFKEYKGLTNILFYKTGGNENLKEPLKLIAVRCVSCGAPLEADPTKTSFNCKFCDTDNVIPASMRYKVVLQDTFIGEREYIYPKHLAFEEDPKRVILSLKQNGRSVFTDKELDGILLEHKNDHKIFKMIDTDFWYLPPDNVWNELFESSTDENIIMAAGGRLKKTEKEMDAKILAINPNYIRKKEPIKEGEEKKPSTLRGIRNILVVLAIAGAILAYFLYFDSL